MRAIKAMLVLSAFATLAGCKVEKAAMADADLVLLKDMQAELAMEEANAQRFVSPLELGATAEEETAEAEEPMEERTVRRSSATSTRRSAATSSRRSSSSGTYSGASTARQPRVVTVRHTKRDAAIGAATGAAIGAVAGGRGNRIKGAVIGGVAGGVAGAIIGHTIDKSTRVEY